jgi:hypothetical protein
MSNFISFRPEIKALMRDFARAFDVNQNAEDLDRIAHILTEVVVGVTSYREEGVRYLPMVMVTDSLETLLKSVNGSDAMVIGESPYQSNLTRAILKTCGPLGEGRQWAIYILLKDEHVQYGIFRADLFPLHQTSFERLRSLNNSQLKIIGITRMGEHVVEVRSASGEFRYIDSAGSFKPQVASAVLKKFVSAVTRDVPSDLKPKMQAFFYRVAVDVYGSSHGTIGAVVDAKAATPAYLSDGVWLKEKFGLAASINTYVERGSEADVLSLVSHGNLIQKMMVMDGVTVFSSAGSVLGFNCFVQDPSLQRSPSAIVGGARRRAYDILCSKLGNDLISVLYKSQDGIGECEIYEPKMFK